jgi:leucyl aminopeptidase (aminopeptidase T)
MKIAATAAVVGTAATVMYAASDSLPAANFLAKEMSPMEKDYAAYLAQHRKNYLSEEEYEHRLAQFAKRHHEIASHNMQGKSWTLEHNFMSDWTDAERKSINGYIPRVRGTSGVVYEEVSIPTSKNW